MEEAGLVQAISGLYTSGLCSDLEIRCGSRAFKAHKAILGARSPVLKRACAGADWKEGKEGVLEIGDPEDGSDPSDDAVAVEMMLQFLYRDDYQPGPAPYGPSASSTSTAAEVPTRPVNESPPSTVALRALSSPPLEEAASEREQEGDSTFPSRSGGASNMDSGLLDLHAKVYALGEKYDMPKLKHCALNKFEQDAQDLEWSDQGFGTAVVTAFATTSFTDTQLKNLIVELLHDRAAASHISIKMDLQICQIPALATMLWKRSVCVPSDGRCAVCGMFRARTCPGKPGLYYTSCRRKFMACDCVPQDATCTACHESDEDNAPRRKCKSCKRLL